MMLLYFTLLRDAPGNDVHHLVQAANDVFGKKTQNKIPVFLEKDILPSIPPIGVAILKMVRPIDFDGEMPFL